MITQSNEAKLMWLFTILAVPVIILLTFLFNGYLGIRF